MGYEVSGFDISDAAIESAKHSAADHGVAERVHFKTGLAEKCEYDSDKFDVVAGVNILHHVEIPAATRECMRMLKPGGIAIFREHIEALLIDRIRNTSLFRWIKPKSASLEAKITEDERKLNGKDLRDIREICKQLEVIKFGLLGRRLKPFMSSFKRTLNAIEYLDHLTLKIFPFLGVFASDVVLVMTKPSGESRNGKKVTEDD